MYFCAFSLFFGLKLASVAVFGLRVFHSTAKIQAKLVNMNLDYFQFLLNDIRDFTLVSNSFNVILIKACGVIYDYIETYVFAEEDKKYSLLQQA